MDMLSLTFFICMFVVFGKVFLWGVKAAWRISKFILTIVFLSVILIALVLGGLLSVAFPLLLVIGIVGLVVSRV